MRDPWNKVIEGSDHSWGEWQTQEQRFLLYSSQGQEGKGLQPAH